MKVDRLKDEGMNLENRKTGKEAEIPK